MKRPLTRDLVCAALLTALGLAYITGTGQAVQPAATAWVDPQP